MNTRYGLSDKTWTCGLYHPKVARYQLRHTQIRTRFRKCEIYCIMKIGKCQGVSYIFCAVFESFFAVFWFIEKETRQADVLPLFFENKTFRLGLFDHSVSYQSFLLMYMYWFASLSWRQPIDTHKRFWAYLIVFLGRVFCLFCAK